MKPEPQRPFQLTTDMVNELNDEIAQLAPNAQDAHDAVGARASAVSFQRRDAAVPDSQSSQALQEHHQSLPADPINPAHYRSHPSGIECIEVTRHMNFNVGNAIKYLWRYMDKGDPVENLKKA